MCQGRRRARQRRRTRYSGRLPCCEPSWWGRTGWKQSQSRSRRPSRLGRRWLAWGSGWAAGSADSSAPLLELQRPKSTFLNVFREALVMCTCIIFCFLKICNRDITHELNTLLTDYSSTAIMSRFYSYSVAFVSTCVYIVVCCIIEGSRTRVV